MTLERLLTVTPLILESYHLPGTRTGMIGPTRATLKRAGLDPDSGDQYAFPEESLMTPTFLEPQDYLPIEPLALHIWTNSQAETIIYTLTNTYFQFSSRIPDVAGKLLMLAKHKGGKKFVAKTKGEKVRYKLFFEREVSHLSLKEIGRFAVEYNKIILEDRKTKQQRQFGFPAEDHDFAMSRLDLLLKQVFGFDRREMNEIVEGTLIPTCLPSTSVEQAWQDAQEMYHSCHVTAKSARSAVDHS